MVFGVPYEGMAEIRRLGNAPLQLSAPLTMPGPSKTVTVSNFAFFNPFITKTLFVNTPPNLGFSEYP